MVGNLTFLHVLNVFGNPLYGGLVDGLAGGLVGLVGSLVDPHVLDVKSQLLYGGLHILGVTRCNIFIINEQSMVWITLLKLSELIADQ